MFEDFRLRIFDTVCRTGSFTAAARALGITQPAVSHSISELEKQLGVSLFVRERQSVRLTEKGERLRSFTDRILYWYDAAQNAMAGEEVTEPAVVSLDGETSVEIYVRKI